MAGKPTGTARQAARRRRARLFGLRQDLSDRVVAAVSSFASRRDECSSGGHRAPYLRGPTDADPSKVYLGCSYCRSGGVVLTEDYLRLAS